ncbi:MAG TPA: Na+:solute symporter, partial [Phycisphaerae bacterium]|nr:Na+:solute symporter [Phycisphaerae bacterium]
MIGSIDPPRLYLLDWAVIAAYALGMLAIGYLFAKRTKSTDEYLTGGRNMRSSSIGLSLFATLMSTITYLAIPGEMINKGPVILWWMATLPVVYLIVGYALIPLFMKLAVTSAYEILETRLGLTGRLTASVIFLATRLLWMALIIYLTADKLIVQMLGWDKNATPWVAAAIGIVTVIYTSMGGLRAVVLTDVIQS